MVQVYIIIAEHREPVPFAEVLHGIDDTLAASGYGLLIGGVPANSSRGKVPLPWT